MLTLGGLTEKRYSYRKRTYELPLNCQKSAEAIVPGKLGRAEPKGG
ncbi:hypothetical protein QA612_02005 [Evansella sp. AB-P1]|nr:hypothetical protein [Evansella sp. AB-P1]MDG5786246.1 hypothetical protein [Evansella sp. AB-P1]